MSISSDGKYFREIIDSFAETTALAYSPGHSGGEARIAAGCCLLAPQLLLRLPSEFRPHAKFPDGWPVIEQDPIGTVLAWRPVKDWPEFWRAAQQVGYREALSSGDFSSPTFLKIGSILLQATWSYAYYHSPSPVDGVTSINDATLLQRFRQIRRHLETDVCEGDTMEATLNSAAGWLIKTGKYSASFFSPNPFRFEIRRSRPSTLADLLARSGGVPPMECQRLLGVATQYELTEALRLPTAALIRSELEIASHPVGKCKKAGVRARREALSLPCAVPLRHGIPRSRLRAIAERVATLDDDVCVFLAAVLFGFVTPRDVMSAKLRLTNSVWLIGTTVSLPQMAPDDPVNLHVPRTDIFWRPIPGSLGKKLKALQANFGLEIESGADKYLRGHFGVTLKKVVAALLTTGPYLFGYSWISADTGFRPVYRTPSAQRAYTCVSVDMAIHAIPYQQLVEPGYDLPGTLRYPCCGSARCPTDETMRSLFAAWRKILVPPPVDLTDPIALMLRWNGVVAGLHSAVLLLTGLRNYEMDPPTLLMLRTSRWDLQSQKKIYGWMLTEPLLPYLRALPAIWSDYVTRFTALGLPCLEPAFEIYCYGFLDLTKPTQLMYVRPRAIALQAGLLGVAELARYGYLNPNFHRSFANTLLRRVNEPEEAIRDFFGNYAQLAQPFRRHSLNVAIPAASRNRLALIIATRVGL